MITQFKQTDEVIDSRMNQLIDEIENSIPSKTSDLQNDSGFITEEDLPEVPSKTSDLQNDSGFITVSSVPSKTSDLQNDSGFITEEDLPTIPSKTSDLQNDSGFITEEDLPDTSSASSVSYDNTTSGSSATNVQAAIDDLYANGGGSGSGGSTSGAASSITYDNETSGSSATNVQAAIDDLYENPQMPSGGNSGQVLTRTSSGYTWGDKIPKTEMIYNTNILVPSVEVSGTLGSGLYNKVGTIYDVLQDSTIIKIKARFNTSQTTNTYSIGIENKTTSTSLFSQEVTPDSNGFAEVTLETPISISEKDQIYVYANQTTKTTRYYRSKTSCNFNNSVLSFYKNLWDTSDYDSDTPDIYVTVTSSQMVPCYVVSEASSASDIPYSNTTSQASSSTVQGAIDELFQFSDDNQTAYETAIIGKGGTVSKAGSIATKTEIVAGINSIQTASGGSSSEDEEEPENLNSDVLLYVKGNEADDYAHDSISQNKTVTIGDGKFDKALIFNGSSYLKIDGSKMGSLSGNFTIEMFVWIDSSTSLPNYTSLFGNYGSGGGRNEHQIDIRCKYDSAVKLVLAINATNIDTSSPSINDGTWHHLAITRDGSTLYGFIDGVKVLTRENMTNDFGDGSTNQEFYIGYNKFDNRYFTGKMCEICVSSICKYTENFTPMTEGLYSESDFGYYQPLYQSDIESIEAAIIGKGGTITKAGSVATASELIAGINSIS